MFIFRIFNFFNLSHSRNIVLEYNKINTYNKEAEGTATYIHLDGLVLN